MSQKNQISIVKETDNWLVINKPPFVPSLPERGKFTAESVMDWSRRFWPEAILCHRIDRETSGALLIAKNLDAFKHLTLQFEHRTVQKKYHAIIDGRVAFEELWVDLPINTEQIGKIRIDKINGKPAQTKFHTLEMFRHFTLMECEPKTGRLHQIRVHLASQNAKIAGDVLYRSVIPKLSTIKRKISGEDTDLIQRFALHAKSLEFNDLDGSRVFIETEYPKDFAVFLKLLNKYDQFAS